MSNLFKVYLESIDKYFVRHIQHQKDKYNYGDTVDKDRLMALFLNRYKNMCTKEKWISKPHEDQKIVTLSSELENMKDKISNWQNYLKQNRHQR